MRSTQLRGETTSLLPNQQTRPKSSCTCIIITAIISTCGLVLAVLVVVGVTLLLLRSFGSKQSANKLIAYQDDTVYLAEVNETNYQVTVQQLCSGSGDHTIELYLAHSCDLQTHCFNVNSRTTAVNSTKSHTITEVHFNGQSHVYMTSSSNITFTVEISTPMANTSLVIFDNYTYFTDFVHSNNPSKDNALCVHIFKGKKSSYTLYGERNTYFGAFESLSNINFTFHYSGYICNYSHLDYQKSKCDLPASTCQQTNCSFTHQSRNKTCLLGYIPQGVTHPTFAYLLVEICQRVPTFNQKTTGIVLLSLAIVPEVFLVCGIVAIYCRKQ